MSESVKLETLVHLIAQGRQEDRQDLAELRADMSEMARNMSKLSNSMSEYMANQKHNDVEIQSVKAAFQTEIHGDNGLNNRVGKLEIAQAEDKQNWRLVFAISGILLTAFAGYYFTIVKPIQNSNVQSEETKALIKEIRDSLIQPEAKP